MSVKPLAFFLTSLVVLMPLAGCFGTEIDNTNLEKQTASLILKRNQLRGIIILAAIVKTTPPD